jgi:glyoxylase-like metal-dependent hydrolase (beta-lactamase superfamily II)
VTVHAIQTGTVTVKRSHACGCLPERTPSPVRFLAILADRRFAAPMPVWTYAIEHPEGLFVVDAGASPSYNDAESWRVDPRSRALFHSFIRLDVGPDQSLPCRLRELGFEPADARAVILTHQHVDHTGSVPAFAGVDIWTTRAEDASASRIGAVHWRWRDARTRIRYVDEAGASDGWGPTVTLTSDGALEAICTPGHTPGSVTVRLRADDIDVWFTGDIAFTAEHMDPTAPTAGIHSDIRAVRALQSRFKGAGMLLPSHDPDVPARLAAYRPR